MNAILLAPSEPLPAAERAQRMAGTLEYLQAEVEQIFSGMPRLLALLMQLFALLRAKLEQPVEVALPLALEAVIASATPRKIVVRGVRRSLGVLVSAPARVRLVSGIWVNVGYVGVEVAPPKVFQKSAVDATDKHAHFVTLSKQY